MDTFGARLSNLRITNNLSQQIVADMLGCSRQAYSYYETNKREPNLETLRKLSAYFNVSADYLLGISDNPKIN